MKLLLSWLSLFICIHFSIAQSLDPFLVTFDSQFEENNFNNLQSKSNLDLFLSIDPGMNDVRRDQIKAEIDILKSKLIKRKILSESPTNQAKILQKILHSKALKYYTPISPFHRVFLDGQYNCVSSTALYALILEDLQIPYVIKEQPTHVYLIMYPEGERIKVETTAPKNSFDVPKGLDIEETVEILIANELISKSKLDSVGYQQAFNDFFFRDASINLRELAGDQYANEAVIHYKSGDTTSSISSIFKACEIHPSQQNLLLKQSILEMKLFPLDFESFEELSYLKEYCNLKLASEEKIRYKLYQYFQHNLIAIENRKLVDSAYHYLDNNVINERSKSVITEFYYLGLSDYYNEARNQKNALKYALKVIEINPSNDLALGNSARFIANEIYEMNARDYYDLMSDEELDFLEEELTNGEIRLQHLQEYLTKYPKLKETTVMKALIYYIYAEIAIDTFTENDEEKALDYMEQANVQMRAIDDQELIDKDLIAWMYASAGAYFYRQGEMQRAMDYIKEGMEISPNHPRLVAKEKIIRRAM
jgi:tetratricopeptide (TPR) repeat protein